MQNDVDGEEDWKVKEPDCQSMTQDIPLVYFVHLVVARQS